MLGVAGLAAAVRARTVTIANGFGTGVADDKAVFAYTPEMVRYYLGVAPILPIIETHLLRDPDVRRMVLRDLDRYVIKPTGASGGYGVVIGPRAPAPDTCQGRGVRRAARGGPSARARLTGRGRRHASASSRTRRRSSRSRRPACRPTRRSSRPMARPSPPSRPATSTCARSC